MWVRDEIRSAVEREGVCAAELCDDEVRMLEASVEHAFAEPGPAPLWERLRFSHGFYDPEGWRRVGAFSSDAANLLVRDGHGVCAFRFASSQDIPRVLAECSGFEFYVCDEMRSYLLAFNHHDFLIGAGTAAHWLGSLPDPPRP